VKLSGQKKEHTCYRSDEWVVEEFWCTMKHLILAIRLSKRKKYVRGTTFWCLNYTQISMRHSISSNCMKVSKLWTRSSSKQIEKAVSDKYSNGSNRPIYLQDNRIYLLQSWNGDSTVFIYDTNLYVIETILVTRILLKYKNNDCIHSGSLL